MNRFRPTAPPVSSTDFTSIAGVPLRSPADGRYQAIRCRVWLSDASSSVRNRSKWWGARATSVAVCSATIGTASVSTPAATQPSPT